MREYGIYLSPRLWQLYIDWIFICPRMKNYKALSFYIIFSNESILLHNFTKIELFWMPYITNNIIKKLYDVKCTHYKINTMIKYITP